MSAQGLPSGLVAFLFSDLEGSTKLLDRLGAERYAEQLEAHRRLLLTAFEHHGGRMIGSEGDSLVAVFETPSSGLAAALDGQLALEAHEWPDGARFRVRIGVHAGEAHRVADNYVGMAVHVAARVSAAGHGGQILTTDVTAALVPQLQTSDLGVHTLKDVGSVRIHQLIHPDLQREFPPIRAIASMANNLPASTDDFVGREVEQLELSEALAECRLVTLVGPGGTGKTRLAVEVATSALTAFPDGAWFVPLDQVADGDQVLPLVASTLRLGERVGETLEEVVDRYLSQKEILLVLDNCEHVVPAVAELTARLMRTCPGVRLLATSRELLGVRGERAFPVAPLSVPDDLALAPASDAVELFLRRAEGAVPGFDRSKLDIATVLDVCRRLDGLPLAIELAVSRLNVLSLEQIAERLDDRFRLLTGGRRTDLPRQRKLEAVVAWSYDLLEHRDQHLFRRLSIFADTFGLEAAESVASGDPVAEADVLDGLAVLVEKSLVAITTSGGMYRYRMLETLRQYGRERLVMEDDPAYWRDRLLAWALRRVDALEEGMRTPRQDALLAEVVPDKANLRLALDWARDRRDYVAALRIATSAPIALNAERRDLLLELIAEVDKAGLMTDVLAGRAWTAIANIRLDLNEWDAVADAAELGAAHFEAAGDARNAAWARYLQVHADWGAGRVDTLDARLDRTVNRFRELGDEMGLGYTLWLAALRERDLDRAVEMSAEADQLLRRVGSPVGLAHNTEGRAIIALDRGDLAEAARFAAEAVDAFSARSSLGCTAHALEVVAVVAHRARRPARVVWEILAAADDLRRRSGQGHRAWEIRARHGAIEGELGPRPGDLRPPGSLMAAASLGLDVLRTIGDRTLRSPTF